jgi:hypothetical protein
LERTILYLASSQIDKEAWARRIAAPQKITSGPVCGLTRVEPCRGFEVYRNRETKKLELVSRLRKCLFLYHYGIHPVFGFHERTDSNLLSLSGANLPERTGGAGPADGAGGLEGCA